jgi:ATP adenylyltransferase
VSVGLPALETGSNLEVAVEIKFTPWRMAYIRGPHDQECVLCRVPAAADDAQNLLLLRGERCFVLLNLYPYNNGHVLVAPYAHVADLELLDPETMAELMALTQRCIRALRRVYTPHGFNLGMNLGRVAGAGIADHLHMHIVPRWQGDMNFMPLIGGTKMIPEMLEETYARVRAALVEEGWGEGSGESAGEIGRRGDGDAG